MRCIGWYALALSVGMLLPATVLAAGGGGHGGEVNWWLKVVLPGVNFVMFVLLLVVLLRKPMRTFFATRRDEIASRLEEAADLKRQAEDKYREYDDKLKALEAEGARILEEARAEGEVEKQKILAAADKAAARVAEDTKRRVAHEVRMARTMLRQEAVTEAVAAARKILTEQLTSSDDEKLMSSTVDQVEKMGGQA